MSKPNTRNFPRRLTESSRFPPSSPGAGENVLSAENERGSAATNLAPSSAASIRSARACTSGSSGIPWSVEAAHDRSAGKIGLLKGHMPRSDRPRMRSFLGRSVLVAIMAAAALIPAQAAFAYTDVPTNHWDYAAIKYVSIDRPYMRDYGTTRFRPATVERRNYMARTLVEMYAPDEPTDPRITFPDLATTAAA